MVLKRFGFSNEVELDSEAIVDVIKNFISEQVGKVFLCSVECRSHDEICLHILQTTDKLGWIIYAAYPRSSYPFYTVSS